MIPSRDRLSPDPQLKLDEPFPGDADLPAVRVLFPNHCSNQAISHICLSLSESMVKRGADLTQWVMSTSELGRRAFIREAMPRFAQRVIYRLRRGDWLKRILESRYLAALRAGDIAWIWPGMSLDLLKRIKDRGCLLVFERINCQDSVMKPILDEAYRRLGSDQSPISESLARESRVIAELADNLFSPSPWVTRSLLEDGVPPDKILVSSYGWSSSRINTGNGPILPPIDGLTILFVGRVCVRKGADLLLEAWARSGVRGRLVLAGRVEPLIAERCASLLNRDDVISLGHLTDVSSVYSSADVFAFPSLEEGSPLVSYEAMGSGLPSVLSPMGAGAVARDGLEAIVLEPYNTEAWAETFRRLEADEAFRRTLGENAKRRAAEFSWDLVGGRRMSLLAKVARQRELKS